MVLAIHLSIHVKIKSIIIAYEGQFQHDQWTIL